MFVITNNGGQKVAALFIEDDPLIKDIVFSAIKGRYNVVHELGGGQK